MRKIKASELVMDFDLYPRRTIDAHNVAEIAQAMRLGVAMPAIVICKRSKRVVDGFHRLRAFIRVHGEKAKIECAEKMYKNDGEMFVDAVRYNAAHGRKLNTCDKAHCALKAHALKIDDDFMATAMHVEPAYLKDLRVDRSAVDGELRVPIKRTISHMAGQQLTKRQVIANDKLSGMNQVFYVNQIIELIEAKLLDKDNAELFERMAYLGELLAKMPNPAGGKPTNRKRSKKRELQSV